MALYKATIRKGYGAGPTGSGDWTNTYTISAIGAANALLVAENVANVEATVHSTAVHFYTATVTPKIPHSENGRQIALGMPGERTPGTEPLPDWNVVGVRFLDLDASRPERKYLRLPIYSEDHAGGALESAILIAVGIYASGVLGISAGGYVCGPNGETWSSYEVNPVIVMRQTDWHRRSRPGFHRGYVPNA